MAAVIPSDLLGSFENLVQYVEEIGLVDMYAADTAEPFRFVRETEKLLRCHDVEIPRVTGTLQPDIDEEESVSRWGDPMSTEAYNRLRVACRALLDPS